MNRNALIVDDSRLACKVMSKMLDAFQIDSVNAYSAEEALGYLESHKPDIIFLDHTMPGMDGLETIKVIKNNPLTATIPVMMYTAKEGGFYAGQARALGAVEVLPKGLKEKDLFNVLFELGLVEDAKEYKDSVALPQAFEAIKKKIAPTPPALVKTITETTENKTKKAKIPAELNLSTQREWWRFWQDKIKPYFEVQKNQQQKAIELRTNLQTRQLTREIHVTLEQLEHALMLRMEAHTDFIASVEEQARQLRQKWFVGIITFVLILQVVVFFRLGSVKELNQSLLASQQEIVYQQIQADERLSELTETLSDLEMTAPAMAVQSEAENRNMATLVDRFDVFVADIFPLGNGLYQGITPKGYKFLVNPQGEVGQIVDEFFYLTDNCVGDVFVKSQTATIFKDNSKTIWYVDKQAELISMNVGSKKSADSQCIILSGDAMQLRQLQRNVFTETGIDEYQAMKIDFKR